MSSRRYSWNGFETTLSSGISAGADTIPLASVTNLRAPGYLVIDPDDLAKREYIEFATINALSLEGCTRNGEGSPVGAVAHDAGATVRAVAMHQFFDDAFDDIESLEGVDAAHTAAADPHPLYLLESELTKAAVDALGVDAATLDGVAPSAFLALGDVVTAAFFDASSTIPFPSEDQWSVDVSGSITIPTGFSGGYELLVIGSSQFGSGAANYLEGRIKVGASTYSTVHSVLNYNSGQSLQVFGRFTGQTATGAVSLAVEGRGITGGGTTKNGGSMMAIARRTS